MTDVWKSGSISKPMEYGILTNEIYMAWAGMKASQYKGIRKKSLRDNMSDLEILLTDIGETATRELAKAYNPQGLMQNKLKQNSKIKPRKYEVNNHTGREDRI